MGQSIDAIKFTVNTLKLRFAKYVALRAFCVRGNAYTLIACKYRNDQLLVLKIAIVGKINFYEILKC